MIVSIRALATGVLLGTWLLFGLVYHEYANSHPQPGAFFFWSEA